MFKSIFTAQEPVTMLFVRARSLLKFGRCFLTNGASNFLNCLASMSTATHCVNLQVLAKLSTSGSCWFSIISAISSGARRTAARSISSPHSLYKLTVCDCSALLSNQVCRYDPGVLHGLLRGVVCSCLSYRRMSFQCTFFVIIIQFKLQPARTPLLSVTDFTMSYDYRTRAFYIGPHGPNGLVSLAVQRVPSISAWDILFLERFFLDVYHVDGLCATTLNSQQESLHLLILFDRHMHLTSEFCPYLIIQLSDRGVPLSMDYSDVVAVCTAVQRLVYVAQ